MTAQFNSDAPILTNSQPRTSRPTQRVLTCGTADQGESTVRRLLYERQLIFENELAALCNDSLGRGAEGDEMGSLFPLRSRSRTRVAHQNCADTT